jgi:KRAB domain-containing zinc finger protein
VTSEEIKITSSVDVPIKMEEVGADVDNTLVINEVQYFCKFCQTFLPNSTSFYNHNYRIHGHKNWNCEKSFTRSDKLKAHHLSAHTVNIESSMITKEESVKEKYKCAVCQKSLPNSKSFYNHNQRVHGLKDFKCKICQKSFNRSDRLKSHQFLIHNTEIEKPKIPGEEEETPNDPKCYCNICQKFLPNPSRLNRHNQRVHGPKDWRCELCPKSFKRSDKLKDHVTSVHKIKTEGQKIPEKEDEKENTIENENSTEKHKDLHSVVCYLKIEMVESLAKEKTDGEKNKE